MKIQIKKFILILFVMTIAFSSCGGDDGGGGIITYIVTFDSQGGSTVDPQTVNEGELVAEPEPPLKGGFAFGGWFREAQCENPWDFDTDTVVSDLTLYAEWAIAESVVTISAIAGVTPPVIGETPVTAITETAQYTGTVAWDGNWTGIQTFAGSKAYTATITLTAKSGYTLTGVAADFFTVAGAVTFTNPADSGVITALFPATETVAVGDSRLGGKVAYILADGDPGYVAGEQRGLIAATADQSSGIQWAIATYQSTAVPGGTGTGLGTGSTNTDNIIAQNGAGTTYAAGLARAYTGGGYTDWYLPSKDELNKLYLNKTAIGGFADYYISSSEDSDDYIWAQAFDDGSQETTPKDDPFERVRAVRNF